MRALTHRQAGSTFRRVGGREGYWMLHAQRQGAQLAVAPDDEVVCPFDFVEVPGLEAEDVIAELRRSVPGTTPILFGSPHEAGMLFERRQIRGKSAEQWLREADELDLDAWLASRIDEFRERGSAPKCGPWPASAQTYNHLTVVNDAVDGKPKPSVIIGLLPTVDPTETSAHLGFGGWNDCPPPPVHVSFARRWHERYGAIQASSTHDSVEFQVAKPIRNPAEAMQVAIEQMYWCSDSVPETLEHAAAELVGSTVWVFWWD